jgi:hypothetical protein
VVVMGKRTFTNLADVEHPAEDLVGIASSASQGAIAARQLEVRPFMRQGEVLETVPGVTATPDGRLGPRLQRSEDCTVSGTRKGPGETDNPAMMCGGGGTPGRLAFGGIPLAVALLPALAREVQRLVVDRTGLTGFFDGALEWTPNPLLAPSADPASPGDAPSIFAAVQEQLGLKLVPATAPVEVYAIDAVAPPTPN